MPCELTRGSQNEVEVSFTSPVDSKKLVADVKGNIMNFWVPWPGFDRDACNNKNLVCPIAKGSKQVFKFEFEIKRLYPKINTIGEFRLRGDNNADVFCFRLPINLI